MLKSVGFFNLLCFLICCLERQQSSLFSICYLLQSRLRLWKQKETFIFLNLWIWSFKYETEYVNWNILKAVGVQCSLFFRDALLAKRQRTFVGVGRGGGGGVQWLIVNCRINHICARWLFSAFKPIQQKDKNGKLIRRVRGHSSVITLDDIDLSSQSINMPSLSQVPHRRSEFHQCQAMRWRLFLSSFFY